MDAAFPAPERRGPVFSARRRVRRRFRAGDDRRQRGQIVVNHARAQGRLREGIEDDAAQRLGLCRASANAKCQAGIVFDHSVEPGQDRVRAQAQFHAVVAGFFAGDPFGLPEAVAIFPSADIAALTVTNGVRWTIQWLNASLSRAASASSVP